MTDTQKVTLELPRPLYRWLNMTRPDKGLTDYIRELIVGDIACDFMENDNNTFLMLGLATGVFDACEDLEPRLDPQVAKNLRRLRKTYDLDDAAEVFGNLLGFYDQEPLIPGELWRKVDEFVKANPELGFASAEDFIRVTVQQRIDEKAP